ncbi:MAG: HAD family hydrolase [Myxococcota bacterium]
MSDPFITRALLEKAERAKASGRDPLVVLDLDGTLYNNAPRTLRILQEFGHLHAEEHPDLLEAVDRLPAGDLAYKVADTLRDLGVTDPALVRKVESFWFERFFTNEYVAHDLPTPGAVRFVERLYRSAVVPAYLTGRDAPNMLIGTVRTLQRDGFPVGTVDTRIILKDDFQTPDDAYKRSIVEHLRAAGEVVGVFDNEPGLCNLFHEAFPEAITVHLDTSHAPGAPDLAEGITAVPDFRSLLPEPSTDG